MPPILASYAGARVILWSLSERGGIWGGSSAPTLLATVGDGLLDIEVVAAFVVGNLLVGDVGPTG